MRLEAILRYPVKGLGPEALDRAALVPGQGIEHDRAWALAHAGSAWDAAAPAWQARRHFVQTAHSPELARVETGFDGRAVTLVAPGREPVAAAPDDAAGAALLASWLEGVAGHRQPGPYRVARHPEGGPAGLWDVAEAPLSILGHASLRALSERAGAALEPRRFRGNLWLEDLAPWEEFDLVGHEIAVGPVRLRVTERIGRCNATAASPATGTRDIPVPQVLEAGWGHSDFGVYAEVVSGGEIAVGDPVARA